MSGGGKLDKFDKRWLEDAKEPGAQALRRALDEAPLDDETAFAKQRVWNRVQIPWAGQSEVETPLRRHSRLVPWLAVAGVALAATGALLGARFLQQGAPVALAPPVAAPRADATSPNLLPLPASIALTTGPDELARHRLARGVSVELASRSALIPGDETTPPEVKVGQVRFEVPHQAPGRRYVVRAGAYQVVVIGTTFDVGVDAAGVAVGVTTGVVAVEDAASGRQLARLTPGLHWTSGSGDASGATPERTPPGPRLRSRAARPRPALAAATAAAKAADPVAARSLDAAGAALRAGDPHAAIERYQRVVDGGGPMAETALYRIGLIQAEDLHDSKHALETWQRHRTQYPTGLLRAETDLSIFEALARAGKAPQALDEARAFLSRHPDSERRAEVARAAGDLARTRGDCRTAIGFYEIGAALGPALPDVDDSAFHRAACLRALGDPQAAKAAHDYLTRFPFGRHAVEAQRLLAGGKVDPQGQ